MAPYGFACGAVFVLLAASIPATAQPVSSNAPLVTVGAAVAFNCPGANDGIPVLPCTRWGEQTPGPHPHVYVDWRPFDRLLVTTTFGSLRFRRIERSFSSAPRDTQYTLVVPARTAWHLSTTAAYVGGGASHRVRGFVGGGLILFRDPRREEVRPEGARLFSSDDDSSGVSPLFTAGALFTLAGRFDGRVAYSLIERMALQPNADGGWRHDVSLGVGWHVR